MSLPLRTLSYSTLRWVLLSAVIVSGTGIWLWRDYHSTLAEAAIQQANVARLLEIHTSHVIANANGILDRVLDEVREHDIMGKGSDRRWPNFGEMAKKLPVSGRLWIYRADGTAVMASHLRHSTNNATDREYFTVQKQPGIGLFIGETVVGKTTGRKVFNLSRRIDAPDGSFAGVAMAAIDIDVFIQVVSELKLGETAAYTLVRGDGAVIMRHPDAGAAGKRFSLRLLDEMAKQPAGSYTAVSAIDGVARHIAYRKHAELPLAIVVSLSRDEVLWPWRKRAMLLGSGLAVLFLVAGWLTVVARKATERERSMVTRMQTVLDTVVEGICGINAQGQIAFINPAGARLFGYEPDELVGKHLHNTTHHSRPDGTPYPYAECPIGILMNQGKDKLGTEHFWRKDGQGFAVEYAAARVDDLDGHHGVVMAFRDVTARQLAEAALRASEEHFRMLAENMADIVWKADSERRFTYINDADRRLRGFEREEVVGQSIEDTLTPEGKAMLAGLLERRERIEAQGRKSEALRFEIPQHCKDGRVIWIDVLTIPMYDAKGNISGYQGIGRDITERRRQDAELEQSQRQLEFRLKELAEEKIDLQEQVIQDPLTGINNRRYLDETLPRELALARREGYPVAVIMIDLDHFKKVNDTYGHAAGDEVLKSLAALLKHSARESDLICRYGGEEFVVVMPRMSAERALQRIDLWRAQLAELRVRYGERDIQITLSAGVAGFPAHGDDMDTLLAHADEMLYRSKSEGRNRVTVYGASPTG